MRASLLGLLVLLASVDAAFAQRRPERLLPDLPIASMEALPDIVSRYAPVENGVQICVPPGDTIAAISTRTEARLKADGVAGLPSPRRIVQAMRTEFACPFTPYRSQLKPAAQADVEGQWVTPVESMRLRHPPRSRAQQAFRAERIRCEAVGYYNDRDMRELQAPAGEAGCPFTGFVAFEEVRRGPRTAEWALPSPGKLVVQPANPAAIAEESDAYAVTESFVANGVVFRVGDLLTWQRRRSENGLNAAVRFRHLRRLRS